MIVSRNKILLLQVSQDECKLLFTSSCPNQLKFLNINATGNQRNNTNKKFTHWPFLGGDFLGLFQLLLLFPSLLSFSHIVL